jgi:cytoskeletal protein CcmA (bactofilin family)
MAKRSHPLFSACVLVCLAVSTTAFAASKADRTSWGHNISVGPNEQVADVTCIACSIRVRGQVAGDVTTVGGSVLVEDQGQVAGDVTAVAGNVSLDKAVKIAGDVTVVGGEMRRDSQASVGGDVTAVGGRGWIVPILLAPFVILGLLVAFIVWLIQRRRRPAPHAAAA